MNSAPSHAELFQKQGFLVVKGFVPEPLLSTCHIYAIKMWKAGKMNKGDSVMDTTPSLHGDILMESMQDLVKPDLEQSLGIELNQTAAFFRVYQPGDVLHRHRDRESCEVAVTMTLGCGSKDRWPFYVEYDGNVEVVTMEPGDAVIYKGGETYHWRYAFEGKYHVQMFFCFVDKNGCSRITNTVNATSSFRRSNSNGLERRARLYAFLRALPSAIVPAQ